MISRAVDDVRPDADARQISIAIEVRKGLQASADDRVLRSALSNLLRNAVKFTRTGENRSGFGLGLSIARQAIAAHGGALTVRNLPGSGCVFVATLGGA